MQYNRLDPTKIEIPKTEKMNTNCIIYINKKLESLISKDMSLDQVKNVACLPGIVGSSLGMPDIHQGYGFPIGGVAAFSVKDGVVSPGGVGYDINCGVRILSSSLMLNDIKPKIEEISRNIFQSIPSGVGSRRKDLKVSNKEFSSILNTGSKWALKNGFATEDDIDCTEDNGNINPPEDIPPSSKAVDRGIVQLGTLGSGNHFIEIGYVDRIYDRESAKTMGIHDEGQVTISVHSGSRGLGHQICTDSINKMLKATKKYHISIPDTQLCCTWVNSPEGMEYLSLMAKAANFAFVNRQIMTHWIRECISHQFSKEAGSSLNLIYDICHNIAKLEKHTYNNAEMELCVHRKGATRAFGPGDPRVPKKYRAMGQPVLIPGDMGRYSFILSGTEKAMKDTFGSACHGAGRLLSRNKAIKNARKLNIKDKLKERGIFVIASGRDTILEEYPEAYKDVTDVVHTTVEAGLGRQCVRLRPLGVIKG